MAQLLATMEPDAVVVMGDVFAEGYKASEQDWEDYLQVCGTGFSSFLTLERRERECVCV